MEGHRAGEVVKRGREREREREEEGHMLWYIGLQKVGKNLTQGRVLNEKLV